MFLDPPELTAHLVDLIAGYLETVGLAWVDDELGCHPKVSKGLVELLALAHGDDLVLFALEDQARSAHLRDVGQG
jgi:hypothetical protein